MRSSAGGTKQLSQGIFNQPQQNMTMFNTKREVDAHLEDICKKYTSEKERTIRFFSIARAYASVREYGLAKRFLTTYIESHPATPGLVEAYKVMGDILVDLNEKESALEHYKKSYEINPNRITLNRVCDLLQNGFGENETPESRKHWFTMQKTAAVAGTSIDSNKPLKQDSFLFNTSQSSPSFGMATGSSPIHLYHNGGVGKLHGQNILKTPILQSVDGFSNQRTYATPEKLENQTKHIDKRFDTLMSILKEQTDKMDQVMKLMKNFTTTLAGVESQNKEITDQVKDLKDECKGFKGHVEHLVDELKNVAELALQEKSKETIPTMPSVGIEPLKPLPESLEKPEGSLTCGTCFNTYTKELLKCPNCEALKPRISSPILSSAMGTNPPVSFQFSSGSATVTTAITPSPAEITPRQPTMPQFTFGLTPKLVPILEPKPTVPAPFTFGRQTATGTLGFGDLAKQSEKSGAFSFAGGTSSSIFSTPPTIFGTKPSPPSAKSSVSNFSVQSVQSTSTIDGSEVDTEDEFIPTAEFAPVIPLPPLVEVKKGDENENTVYEVRAKLLRLHTDEKENTKEWKERGTGNIKILQDRHKSTKVRIVMWREQIHKLACNHWIEGETSVSFYSNSLKALMWSAMDFAEGEPKKEIFVCKFGKLEQCKEFKDHLDRLVADIKNAASVFTSPPAEVVPIVTPQVVVPLKPLSEIFKKPEGSWTCETCYNSNTKEHSKCPSCETLKPGTVSPIVTSVVSEVKLPEAPKFIFGFQPVKQDETSGTKFVPPPTTTSSLTSEIKPTETPLFSFGLLPGAASFGFGDLAKQNEKSNGFSFAGGSGSDVFTKPVAPIFGTKLSSSTSNTSIFSTTTQSLEQSNPPTDTGDAEHDDFIPTAEFAPVIPLPPLVEVKKGDENENTVYEIRAKLLRLHTNEKENTKEWKERGTGNIKILQDRQKNTKVRIVMWREQIHKLACNHWIEAETSVTYFSNSDKALMWSAMDFAEGEAKKEIFVCKFGKQEQCKEFKGHLDRLVVDIKHASASSSLSEAIPTATSQVVEPLKPLSEIFKKREGSWTCDTCYNSNTKEHLKCPSCETLKPGTVLSNFTSSTSEAKVTEMPKFAFGFQPVGGSLGFGDSAKQNETSVVKLGTPSPITTSAISEVKPLEAPIFSFGFQPVSGNLGFGDLAKQSEKLVGYSFIGGTGSDIFSKPTVPIFGTKLTSSNPNTSIFSTGLQSLEQSNSSTDTGDAEHDDFIPTAEFAPVIPLPPLVEVKKGDENENTIYEIRAKLLRLHTNEKENTKEWKERGTGNIKILQDRQKNIKIRIVMWREQIHKLACNHWIEAETSVTFFSNSDKALMWSAMDFAEGEAKKEIFVCKFGKPEHCKEFKGHLDRLVTEIKQENSIVGVPTPSDVSNVTSQQIVEPLKPLSEIFKKPEGSWSCGTCCNNNTKEMLKCPSCDTLKPGTTVAIVVPAETISITPTQFEFEFKKPAEITPPMNTSFTSGSKDSPTPCISDTADSKSSCSGCIGCDPDKFNFSQLEKREIPTYEEQTMSPEEYADFLEKSEGFDKFSTFSFSSPSPSIVGTPVKCSTPTQSGSFIGSNSPFSTSFGFGSGSQSFLSTSGSPVKPTVVVTPQAGTEDTGAGASADAEDGDEYEDDEIEEPMFEGEVSIRVRYPEDQQYTDMGKGIGHVNYDNDLYCSRFSFLDESGQMSVEHVICADTHLQSIDTRTFAWSGLQETEGYQFVRIEFQAIFETEDLYNSFLDRWSDSQDIASQAGVTEEYLAEDDVDN